MVLLSVFVNSGRLVISKISVRGALLQCYHKQVKCLLGVASWGEHCVLATRTEDSATSGQYGLILCNAISTPVDSMYCADTLLIGKKGRVRHLRDSHF